MNSTSHVISRDALIQGELETHLAEAEAKGLFVRLSEEARKQSRADIMARFAPDEDIWVFGYGSLMWNPAFEFDEQRTGTIYGRHRRFCLRTMMGRGDEHFPGLTLGLDRGGSCSGILFRVDRSHAAHELDLIWQREMITDVYQPVITPVQTPSGTVRATTFAINRDHHRYAGDLDMQAEAEIIARATGWLGTCREYLYNTVDMLETRNIPDQTLHRLCRMVRQIARD